MPFRLFLCYEAELFVHQAYQRISDVHAQQFANGAARKENGEYTDVFRDDLETARIVPRRGA